MNRYSSALSPSQGPRTELPVPERYSNESGRGFQPHGARPPARAGPGRAGQGREWQGMGRATVGQTASVTVLDRPRGLCSLELCLQDDDFGPSSIKIINHALTAGQSQTRSLYSSTLVLHCTACVEYVAV